MRTWLSGIAVLAGAAAAVAPAKAEIFWRVLDQRVIRAGGGDRQVIEVGTDRPFSSMRLCVTQQGVRFDRIDVRFRDGGSRTYLMRQSLPNQRCTHDIVFAEGARPVPVAEIAISYDEAGLSRRGARMQLHAR